MQQTAQRHETIKITVDSGDFTYSKAVVQVRLGDLIKWVCKSPFGVSFKHTPFKAVDFQCSKVDTSFETTEAEIVGVPGTYHYAVAVAVGTDVWINAGCPEVKVKP